MRSVGSIFADILVDAGIDHVFGLPGGGTGIFFNGLFDKKDKIRTVLVRHEGGAACMADVYGRLTGKPAVLMGQGLWIGTSGGFGIVESYLAGVPMLIICDVSDYSSLSQFGPYQNSTGEYGAINLPNMMRSMTKYTTYATNASELIHGVQLAIKHATTGRPGPACVLVKWSAVLSRIDPDEANPKLRPLEGYLKTSPPCISQSDSDRVADLLLAAENPIIVAGAGVQRAKAYAELQELAELTGIPVATTYMGKSSIPETHDCALGTIGQIGQKAANETLTGADLIFASGTCLAPDNTKMLSPDFIDPERQKIIQIDIEPLNTGWTFPLEIGITSELKLALSAICDSIKNKSIPYDVKERVEKLQTRKAEANFFNEEFLFSDSVPIAPERVVKELNDQIGPDDIIVLDAGNNRMWMAHHFQTKGVGQIIAAGGAAGVGYGPPATLSAQMLNPEKRVIGICGDGGLMMHLYTLEMAVEYELPMTLVVMNNACLGNVMDFQKDDRRIATTYPRAKFYEIARGFGVESILVEKPEELKGAFEKALNTNKPVLIDVVIDDCAHFRMMPQ
ncbi:MAG: thiamine pyrophosphate-binding protein [Deltaproteobacteria bacterium]|nr:thiamine pyrophosphate-binding protein [Deltaproteobacteria bacterium]MBW2051289.1 thiamine pyrophosphate-binding protein [Deltaproteobacteria bacterium]MBW2140448.1 thiamine pyrophosphate-binding protein [Deltaproteobacteria bacterium]MBW2323446.1 thiamine pyrophosphate-binding protein [Deltaproteobacteria bacterium]